MPLNFVAKAAITVGMAAANMALTMSRKIEGPRLDSTKFTGGDYGAPLQMLWGKRRLECPIFWAEEMREVKRERKTKGGKYNDYTYYGTWAVALAGHEIHAITRIWFDTHLVFDLTGAGPVSPFFPEFLGVETFRTQPAETAIILTGLAIKGKATGISRLISFYPGSETQEPDPRMQATIEAEFGEGSCPAYRGTAYMVFKDVPLAKLGNRIPQVSIEVVTSSDTTLPYATVENAWENHLNTLVSHDKSLIWFGGNLTGGAPFTVIDAAARTNIITGEQPAEVKAVDPTGILWAIHEDDNRIIGFNSPWDVYTSSAVITRTGGADAWIIDLFGLAQGDTPFVGVVEFGGSDLIYFTNDEPTVIPLSGWAPTWWCSDLDGDVWAFGKASGSTTSFYMLNVTGTGYHHITGLSASTSGPVARHYQDSTHDHFLVERNGDLLIIDRVSGVVLDFIAGFGDSPYVPWKNGGPSDATWFQYDSTTTVVQYSAVDGSAIRTLSLSDWSPSASQVHGVYDPISHAWIGLDGGGDATWYFLDRIAGSGVTLGQIASDVAGWCGVTDHDFSALDQTVQGWSATQGQASNMLEPLLDAYDSDIRPHDFTLQGIKRAGVSGGTILTERFAKADPRYTVKVRQAAELPRAVTVTFADVDGDQQPNTARADRPLDATGAKGEQSIDMGTWASDKTEARNLTDRFFRRMWNERKEVSLALTAQHLSLEPGDCRTLDLDGESDTYRLTRLTVKADDTLATEWKYDHPSLALTDGATGAAFDGRNESVIVVPLLSKGFVLDIPLLTDSDNSANPLLYVAAAPYAAGSWPGAVIYEGTSGEYSDETASVQSSAPATWGYATDVLPETNPWLWDRGSSVNVMLQTGSLTGTTEAAIDADPTLNLALIGDELVNFTTATLESDGSYTLSGFKRGRRGTEWACGSHAARDVFLLMDTAQDVEQGLSEVGTDLTFKAVTNGRTAAGSFTVPVAYTGASLKPYAPVHLEAVQESNGDWTLSWVRRTRVGGAWTSGTSIPLGEASEEYEVEILNGSTVVRTITGLTSPTATWTDAQQVTDMGSGQSSASFRVYQISASVDRGFAATA